MRRILCFFILICLPIVGYSAGDYVWEEKFNKLLPKAEAGDVKAQYDIGEMYERGRGATKNASNAFEWYLKAAEQGNKKAAYRIGVAYLKGKGVKKNHKNARKWLEVAANKNYERAYYYLGEIYEKGLGVDQNYNKALKWYKKAQNGGFAPAVDRVARVTDAKAKADRRKAKLAEAAARKKLARRTNRKSNKKVSMKPASLTTKEILMKGGWRKKNKPAEFMPSNVASCDDSGKTLECVSRELQRNIGMADITYRTKAIVYSINDNGSFKISYRNNVTAVRVTDPDFAASGNKVPVKEGWQDAEHTLSCQIESKKTINCKKNKTRSLKFTRK